MPGWATRWSRSHAPAMAVPGLVGSPLRSSHRWWGRCVNNSGSHLSLRLWGFRSEGFRRCTSLPAAANRAAPDSSQLRTLEQAYPDTRAEALLGPVVFSPLLQGAVWGLVRSVVRSDAGLRMMLSQLSNLPTSQWWDLMSAADKDEARNLFRAMRSDSGFTNDLRQGQPRGADARRQAMSAVQCPTLVTASRNDGGVSFAHAEDFARVIPDADLVELSSPSHLFWLGSQRAQLMSTLHSFIQD